MEEQFDKEIHALAQQRKGLHDQAVAVYTPLVDDICSRVAPMKEVEWLLDYMFGFAGVRILANCSLSSLLFAKGLSAGISGNEGLSFIVSNI